MSAPNMRDGKPEFPAGGGAPSIYTDDLEKWCCCEDISGCDCCNPTGACPDLGPNQATVTISGVGQNTDTGWDYLKCQSGCDTLNGTYVMGDSERVDGQCKWVMDITELIGSAVPGETFREFCTTKKEHYRMHEDWGGHPDCLAVGGVAAGFGSGQPYDASALYSTAWYGSAAYDLTTLTNPNAFPRKMAKKAGDITNDTEGESQLNAIDAGYEVESGGEVYTANLTNWTTSETTWTGPEAFSTPSKWTPVNPHAYTFTDASITVEVLFDTPSDGVHQLRTDIAIGSEILMQGRQSVTLDPADGDLCALPLEKQSTGTDEDLDVAVNGALWPGLLSGFLVPNALAGALCNWSNHGDYNCATEQTEEVADGGDWTNPQNGDISVTCKVDRV